MIEYLQHSRLTRPLRLLSQSVKSAFDRLGQIGQSPSEYGINCSLASTVLQALSVNRDQTLDQIDFEKKRRATWLTSPGKEDINWIIGLDGQPSMIGIRWIENRPLAITKTGETLVVLENQKIEAARIINLPSEFTAAVISVKHLEEKRKFYLCLKLEGSDWIKNIAPAVDGLSLVSGMGIKSGPFRDWFYIRSRVRPTI